MTAALFTIGLDAYWPQFPGLRERIEHASSKVAALLHRAGAEVLDLGLIDTTDKAAEAGEQLRRSSTDIVFMHVATYALSSTVLPVVRRANAPVVVLNLAPAPAIDYAAFNAMRDRGRMTGEWLAHCQACPLPEIANVLRRCGIPFHQVAGVLDGDPHVEREISEWVQAAGVAHGMERHRVGLMGHYYGGMLDVYTDLTLLSAVFGSHFEHVEVDELAALRLAVAEPDTRSSVALFREQFDIQSDVDESELEQAAKTAIALDRLVERHRLGSMAYYYQGHEETIGSIILGTSLLTARGVPVAGEYEVKNVHAMKIMDLFGAGGSFTEYYAVDYADDVVLMGHDGPGHIAIGEGKIKVRPLGVFHGKVGRGISVEMSVKHGPVTLLSVAEDPGRTLKLVVAEGESTPGPILEIGNTNSRYRFRLGARGFIEAWNAQGPAHHCAVGVGHIASAITKLGKILDIPVVQVC